MVAYDFGIKRAILRHLGHLATVEVVPASTPAADVLARQPDGVFLSNGPGDPTAVGYATGAIRELLGQVPVFGICLGHQLLATALGRRHLQAAVRSSRRQPSGAAGGDQCGRDHQPEPQLRRRPTAACQGSTSPTSTSTTVSSRGSPVATFRPLASSTTPRRGPDPHDASYLFEEFRALMAKGA